MIHHHYQNQLIQDRTARVLAEAEQRRLAEAAADTTTRTRREIGPRRRTSLFVRKAPKPARNET